MNFVIRILFPTGPSETKEHAIKLFIERFRPAIDTHKYNKFLNGHNPNYLESIALDITSIPENITTNDIVQVIYIDNLLNGPE